MGMPVHVLSPKNCVFARRSGPHLIRGYLSPHDISIGSAVIAQLTAECRPRCRRMPFPLKIAPSHGGSEPQSNTLFLKLGHATRVHGREHGCPK